MSAHVLGIQRITFDFSNAKIAEFTIWFITQSAIDAAHPRWRRKSMTYTHFETTTSFF